MDSKCGFCLTKLKKDAGVNVKELIIDTNDRKFLKFTDVLFDLFHCEFDVTKLCTECMEGVNKQYQFKERLKKVVNMPPQKHVEILRKVQNFLTKTSGNVNLVTHLDILSIVPHARSQLMVTIQNLNPEVQLTRTRTMIAAKNNVQHAASNSTANSSKVAAINASSHRPVPLFLGDDRGEDEYASADSDDSEYRGKQKMKRKKRTSAKIGRASKRRKMSNDTQFVKQEPQEIDPLEVTYLEVRLPSHFESEPESTSNVLNSSRLMSSLNDEQKEWLNDKLAHTKRKKNEFICNICSKIIKSPFGIKYHYINLHYMKTNSQQWVSRKMLEGKKIIKTENDGVQKIFSCTDCSIVYTSQQGLRYHLKNDARHNKSKAKAKDSKSHNILHFTKYIRTLTDEQREWLEGVFPLTKNKNENYTCSLCAKIIKTYYGISYHYISRHYKKSTTNSNLWVSQKVKQASETTMCVKKEKQVLEFKCTECPKVYKNQPGLRYHLKQHLKSDAIDDEFCESGSENETEK